MIKDLEKLPASDVDVLLKAPLLVCILIAGADGDMDKKEVKGAINLAKKAKTKANLSAFYKMVTEDFEDKLKIVLQEFPVEATQRNPLIIEELARLNAILPRIDKGFASDYYKSLIYIAREIAESSGGMLGLNSVGDEETKMIQLKMIKNPAA